MFRTVGTWFGLEEPLPPPPSPPLSDPGEGTAAGDAAPEATSQVKGLSGESDVDAGAARVQAAGPIRSLAEPNAALNPAPIPVLASPSLPALPPTSSPHTLGRAGTGSPCPPDPGRVSTPISPADFPNVTGGSSTSATPLL